MIDMGVPSYLVAGSVIGVLAQRLVRVICTKCKQPFSPPQRDIDAAGFPAHLLEGATFMKGRGCSHCGNSGYRGRLGVFELMTMTSEIRELTFQGGTTQDIRRSAIKRGMTTLYDDALLKVARGITTIEEVFRVAKKVQ
jgi:type IV pilus assembly protein PilB